MAVCIVIGLVVKVNFVQVCIQYVLATIFKGRIGLLTSHSPSSSDRLEVIRNLFLFYLMTFSREDGDGLDKAIDVGSLRREPRH